MGDKYIESRFIPIAIDELINGEANHRPSSIGCGKGSAREGRGEGGHRNCLTVHTQKETGEREALLMIIFLTPRKMTAITPSAVERKEAVTDCRPCAASRGRARAEAL